MAVAGKMRGKSVKGGIGWNVKSNGLKIKVVKGDKDLKIIKGRGEGENKNEATGKKISAR
jgi:hypothetical protein